MKYVIANLKMNPVSLEECDHYLTTLKQEWQKRKLLGVQLVVCAPFVYLDYFKKHLPQDVALGAQNVFWETRGSFTGETSPLMLKNFGVQYVIIGHSERRGIAGETDEMVHRKVQVTLKEGLRPIVCVGETEEERLSGNILPVVRQQVDKALEGVSLFHLKFLVIAYEPRWAIGADRTPTSHEIMEMRVLLRKILVERYGTEAAAGVALLYGGSVKTGLVRGVCLDPGMDGVLVGRESLLPLEMVKMSSMLAETPQGV